MTASYAKLRKNKSILTQPNIAEILQTFTEKVPSDHNMLSNLLMRIPFKTIMESGDCTCTKFSPEYFKNFNLAIEKGEECLHPVNKFFAALDPEMWEISNAPGSSSESGHRDLLLPSSALFRIFFSYSSKKDLKNFRGVCQQWRQTINQSEIWTEHFVALMDGAKAPWLGTFVDCVGSKCASYLETSRGRFKFWKHMRIRCLQDYNFRPLLTHHASNFRRAIRHIETLELIHCSLAWTEFLELMYLFRGLKTLYITQCNIGNCGSMSSQFMTVFGLTILPQFQEILDEINAKCPEEDYYFRLKNLHLIESDDQDKAMTPLLLAILKDRTGLMDSFSFNLGYTTTQLRAIEDHNSLWQAVHSFLGQKNVVECTIESLYPVFGGMVNRCFTYMGVWKFPPKKSEFWRLRDLKIHLHPLMLWNSFERHFIPMVQRFPFLQALSLKHIILRGNKAYLVKELMEQCPDDCKLEIGLILDDQGGPESAMLEKELLSSQLYQKHLVSIDGIIYTDCVREVRDMIPYKKDVVFRSLKSFTMSTNGAPRPRFFTFNINVLVHNFPNITELQIIDGPPIKLNSIFSSYSGMDAVWKDMSGAVIGDDDIQLLLKTLKSLQTLVIRANMKYMTDSGLTGYSGQYCRSMIKRGNLHNPERRALILQQVPRNGVSFANLPSLREISIEGLGAGITDVSVYFGFIQGMKPSTPKFIHLFGAHMISKAGRLSFQKYFPECDITVN